MTTYSSDENGSWFRACQAADAEVIKLRAEIGRMERALSFVLYDASTLKEAKDRAERALEGQPWPG